MYQTPGKENEYRGDNGNQVYQQKFSFDRFGNRYLKASENPSNQNPLAPTPIEDNNIERATNRFAANTGTVYDDAGNVVSDDKFREMDFVYDANGRMAKAIKASFPEALSVFDAGGNKVATRVNDVWRFQIYDAGGKCVAEYGGPQSADDGGVKYTHQDIQGSTRTISTQAGSAQARMDYQAFGEQISSGIGQRTATGFAATDSLRNRYALTERDEATGLDDTWFRKLENRGGRWTSPDPYNGSASIGNGQSWNRYSYVENQPTNYVDPSGLNMASIVCWDVVTNGHYTNDPSTNWVNTTTVCDISGGGTWDDPDPTPPVDLGVGGGSGGEHANAGTLATLVNAEETFKDCLTDKVKKALNRFKEDMDLLIGATVVGAAFAFVAAVLIAALLEPTQIGKVVVGAAVGVVVTAVIAYIFADQALRNQLSRAVEDAIDDCKGKPGTPDVLPSVEDAIKRFGKFRV